MKKDIKIYDAKNLYLWNRKIRGVSIGTSHVQDGANPIIVGKYLIFSCFSPGLVVVMNALTKKIIWKKKFNYLGGFVPKTNKNNLFIGTSQELHCLDLKTGKIKWTFCPYGLEGEHMYSQPLIENDNIYLGDREGFVYCLSAKDGNVIWKTQTGDGDRNQVNATVNLKGNFLYVVNICRRLLVVDKRNGKIQWWLASKAASIYQPQMYKNNVVIWNNVSKGSSLEENLIVDISTRKKAVAHSLQVVGKRLISFKVLPNGDYLTIEQKTRTNKPENISFPPNAVYYSSKNKRKAISTIEVDEFTNSLVDVGLAGYLCIVGYGHISFYSLKKKKLTLSIKMKMHKGNQGLLYPGAPLINGNKLYYFTLNGYLTCLKMPRLL